MLLFAAVCPIIVKISKHFCTYEKGILEIDLLHKCGACIGSMILFSIPPILNAELNI